MNYLFLSRYFLPILLVLLALPARPQRTDAAAILVVTTKSGKTLTFIDKPQDAISVQIAEWHWTKNEFPAAIFGGSIKPFWMFDIRIVTDEFSKRLSMQDVASIRFLEVKKGVFRIAVSCRDKKLLTLSLQGEYLDAGDDDGVLGTEIVEGEIKVPFSKIHEIQILKPERIGSEHGEDVVTEAKLDSSRSIAVVGAAETPEGEDVVTEAKLESSRSIAVVGAAETPKEVKIVSDKSLFGADRAKALSTRVAIVLAMPPGSMKAGWAIFDPQPSINAVRQKYGEADKVVAREKDDNLPKTSSVHWYGRLGLSVAKYDATGKVFWVLVEP